MRRSVVVPGTAGLLTVAACLAACSKPGEMPEPGAFLLRLQTPAQGPAPEMLRISVYDDGGVVFKNARVPETGTIVGLPAGGSHLGTVLIQPGMVRGPLRLHVRGVRGVARVSDGVARVPEEARRGGTFDLVLAAGLPVDTDGDDVPDAIDDCPAQANPQQGGCSAATPDGGGDAAPAMDAGAVDGATGGMSGGGGGGAASGGAAGGGGAGVPAGSGGAAPTEGTGGGTAGAGSTTGTGGAISSGGTAGSQAPGDAGISFDATPVDARADGAGTDGSRKALGATCASSAECGSNFCVDSVCCQSACNLPCQICAAAGRCNSVTRATDTPECAGSMTCNPAGRCVAN